MSCFLQSINSYILWKGGLMAKKATKGTCIEKKEDEKKIQKPTGKTNGKLQH